MAAGPAIASLAPPADDFQGSSIEQVGAKPAPGKGGTIQPVKLIIQPGEGVSPIVAAIRSAKKSVDIAIFRFDYKDIEAALRAAAAQKNVKVTALIAFANRGGEKNL